MGTMKVKGNAATLAKAGKTDPGTYKVYAGETPPNGVYRLTLRTMEAKINSSGDPWVGSMLVIDEAPKKGTRTNPKARFNGAIVRGSQNMDAERSNFWNGFMAALGVPRAKWPSVWKVGFKTTARPGKNDAVASIGGRTLEQMCADHVYADVFMETGGINKVTKKKYPDRLSVRTWLTANDILENMPEDEDDEESDSDEDETEDEESEEPEAEDEESEEESEDEESDEYEARKAELDGMTRTQLKALLKPAGSEMVVTKAVTEDEIVAEILGLEFEDAEGSDDEEEEEEEEESDEDDGLDELDRSALKAVLAEEEIDFRVTKSKSDDDIRQAIRDARASAGDDEEEEEEEEDAPPPKTAKKGGRRRTAGEPPF